MNPQVVVWILQGVAAAVVATHHLMQMEREREERDRNNPNGPEPTARDFNDAFGVSGNTQIVDAPRDFIEKYSNVA